MKKKSFYKKMKNILLLFCLIAYASSSKSNNLILVGDSRMVQMCIYYMRLVQYDGKNVRMTSPKNFQGYSIEFTAQGSASYATYQKGSELYNSVIYQLENAQEDTNVILWLGINSVGAPGQTYSLYEDWAKQYPKINFYATSITGVDESRWKNVPNYKTQSFNNQLKNSCINGPKNLKYLDILYNNDPNRIVSGGNQYVITSTKYSGDGLHYYNDGYRLLFYSMVEKIE